MLRHILFLFILMISYNNYAQNIDSNKIDKEEDIRGNEFSISNYFKTNDVYVGTYDGAKNLLLNLEFKYRLKMGLYIAVAPDFLFNEKRVTFSMPDIGFTLGYDQDFGKNLQWNLYGGYTFYWQNINSKIPTKLVNVFKRFRNLQNHNITIGGSWENDIITPNIEVNLLAGSVFDWIVTPSLSHEFYIFENKKMGDLYFEPFNNYNFGTANNILTYSNRSVTTGDYPSLLNTEIGLNINYQIHFFEIEPSVIFSHSFRNFNSTDVKNGNFVYGTLSLNLNF